MDYFKKYKKIYNLSFLVVSICVFSLVSSSCDDGSSQGSDGIVPASTNNINSNNNSDLNNHSNDNNNVNNNSNNNNMNDSNNSTNNNNNSNNSDNNDNNNNNNNTNDTTNNNPGDIVPPLITKSTPTNNSDSISITCTLVLTFNEALKQTSVSDSSIKLTYGDIIVPINVTYDDTLFTVTVKPKNHLNYSTAYKLSLNNIEDLAGNAMSEEFVLDFNTSEEPDLDEPHVTTTNPENNAQNIDINSNIEISFSEAINEETLSNATIQLKQGSSVITAKYSYNSDTHTITINPTSAFSFNTDYSVVISGLIQDLNGNNLANPCTFTFSTMEEPDTEAPRYTASSPTDAATDIDINNNIEITFSEAINESTLSSSTIQLKQGSLSIAAGYSYNSETYKLTIDPDSSLSYDTTYDIIISDLVQDLSGNSLENPSTLSFTTMEEPDTEAPRYTASSPTDAATDIDINNNIEITFSEAINESTLSSSTIQLKQGSLSIAAGYSYNSETYKLTIDPDSPLSYETTYSIVISDLVQDLSGNDLENPSTLSFTTIEEPDTTGPVVLSSSPTNGSTDVHPGTTFEVTFDELLNPSTVSTSTVILSEGGIPRSDAVVTYNASQKKVSVTIGHHFIIDASYSVTMTTGITDLAGNALQSETTITFATDTIFNTSYGLEDSAGNSYAAYTVHGADIDGDGHNDVVTSREYMLGDTRLVWYKHNGSFGFTRQELSFSYTMLQAAIPTDMDNDGDADIVTLDVIGTTHVEWLRNNGSGTFTRLGVSTGTSLTAAQTIFVTDFGNDEHKDVIIGENKYYSTNPANRIFIFLNNGSESFSPILVDSSLSRVSSIAAGDFDGDTDIDIVAAHVNGSINWYKNNGSNSFTKHSIPLITGCVKPVSITAGDIDDDNDLDLVVGSYENNLTVYINNGSGSFTGTVISNSLDQQLSVHIADIDNDGDGDIAVTSRNADVGAIKLTWYEYDKNSFVTHVVVTDSDNSGRYVQSFDIDKDGDLDLLTGFDSGSSPVRVIENNFVP